MNSRGKLAVQASVLLVALCASAAVKDTIRIKVLDSESRSFSIDNNGVPKNCDPTNYDAYCHSSKTAEIVNTLLIQEGDEPPFRVSCTIDSRWSRCVPLQKGTSFDARKEKNGIVVYYVDDNGKVRKQLYTYVAEAKGKTAEPLGAGPMESSAPAKSTEGASIPAAAAGNTRETVKCSFSSTPSGAEITLDGQYVGSTPSGLSVSTGKHVVTISMPGFTSWKRELTVSPGSELTVNAVLEKAQ